MTKSRVRGKLTLFCPHALTAYLRGGGVLRVFSRLTFVGWLFWEGALAFAGPAEVLEQLNQGIPVFEGAVQGTFHHQVLKSHRTRTSWGCGICPERVETLVTVSEEILTKLGELVVPRPAVFLMRSKGKVLSVLPAFRSSRADGKWTVSYPETLLMMSEADFAGISKALALKPTTADPQVAGRYVEAYAAYANATRMFWDVELGAATPGSIDELLIHQRWGLKKHEWVVDPSPKAADLIVNALHDRPELFRGIEVNPALLSLSPSPAAPTLLLPQSATSLIESLHQEIPKLISTEDCRSEIVQRKRQ